MSEQPLSDLGYERYFSLLRQVIPDGMEFYLCDQSGTVLAADKSNISRVSRTRVRIDRARKHAAGDTDSRLVVEAGPDEVIYAMEIRSPAGDTAGFLVATCGQTRENSEVVIDAILTTAFTSVTECIEKEYRLTTELNAMAQELAGRYEELNLVYEADDSAAVEQEHVTLKQLIENYVTYLDVDMVALVYPDQERVLCANSRRDPVHEPGEVIRQLSRIYLPQARARGNCLLVNDIGDPRRDELALDMPYKILSCPVVNSRGVVEALLICINHIYRADFFNSDRSLLSVMARKVAKITQANYDTLTGLVNHHAFTTVLERALRDARSEGLVHCLMNLDIDQLQILNEFHGREAGDHTIRAVAELLREKLRSTDTIGYLGEGRYGILLENCGIEQGMKLAYSLREHVQQSRVNWGSRPLDFMLTLGVTMIEPHAETVGELLEAAELAREAAKEQGRGQIHLYQPGDTDLAERRNNMHCAAYLQKALRENLFELYCQTILPVRESGEQYHLEILLRLFDEEGAMIGAGSFIPVAEQFNLMPSIDRWVVDATLARLAEAGLADAPGQGLVSINLSGQSLGDVGLADYIEAKIGQYGIASECLCFEVTETAAINNKEAALAIISRMQGIGCSFSLDDFGTGLSSFSYLKELPVDFVKIDGSFVTQTLEDQVSHAMVASIIQIAHVMGLSTVAEYVENEAIAERLVQMGVDYLQGYAIDRAQPLSEYLSTRVHSKSVHAG